MGTAVLREAVQAEEGTEEEQQGDEDLPAGEEAGKRQQPQRRHEAAAARPAAAEEEQEEVMDFARLQDEGQRLQAGRVAQPPVSTSAAAGAGGAVVEAGGGQQALHMRQGAGSPVPGAARPGASSSSGGAGGGGPSDRSADAMARVHLYQFNTRPKPLKKQPAATAGRLQAPKALNLEGLDLSEAGLTAFWTDLVSGKGLQEGEGLQRTRATEMWLGIGEAVDPAGSSAPS